MYEAPVVVTLNTAQAKAFSTFCHNEAKRIERKINGMYSRINVLSDTKYSLQDLAESVASQIQANVPDLDQHYSYNN